MEKYYIPDALKRLQDGGNLERHHVSLLAQSPSPLRRNYVRLGRALIGGSNDNRDLDLSKHSDKTDFTAVQTAVVNMVMGETETPDRTTFSNALNSTVLLQKLGDKLQKCTPAQFGIFAETYRIIHFVKSVLLVDWPIFS